MKAGTSRVPDHIIDERKRTGAHRWDEMWNGVWHMPPSPNRLHQDLEGALEACLREHWARPRGCYVYHQINVAAPGCWPTDYRIPDLVLLTPKREEIDKNEYFDGAPEAVVEIHSPGDKAYEKLEFYARIGVLEVWIVDRDTKSPELFELVDEQYVKRAPDVDGWILSAIAGVELRAENARLAIRRHGDASSHALLP